MNAQHTPTPWTKDDKWGDLRSPDGKTIIVYGLGIGNRTSPDDESVANATFIVRACNSHDALVAALSSLKWKSADKDNMEYECRITYSQMDAIRAALAAAGES